MKVNAKILNFSLWISLLTIFTFPGGYKGLNVIEYGFPVSFLTSYSQEEWLVTGVNINILNYFINTFIIYLLLVGFIKIYNKLKHNNKKY